MVETRISRYARQVATLASTTLSEIEPQDPTEGYTHMGALLTDSILQAGVNYQNVVAPRVSSVLQRFPYAITTFTFREILLSYGACNVLRWTHPEKPRRLLELTTFLVRNCVFTKSAFNIWLSEESNVAQLGQLSGIGPKTIDYLRKLCGIDAIAVDRHIRTFVSRAGVPNADYEMVRKIVEQAADLLDKPRSALDRAIWRFESGSAS